MCAPLTLALACTAGGGESNSEGDSETEPTTEPTTTEPTTTGPTTTGPTTTIDPTETTTIDPTETTTINPTTGPAVCGNGIIEPGEMCDDGNVSDDDGCQGDCTLLAGEMWWRETIDGGDMDLDRGQDVAVDAEGNIYIVGTVLDPFTQGDVYVRKYDPIGTSIWTRNYDGGVNLNDQGVAIAGDASGFMVVAGRQTQEADAGSRVWLSKCDPNGQILWQTAGAQTDSFAALAMFSATHFIAAGTTKEGMDTNALIRRYDDQPSEQWSAIHAGAAGGPDSAADVAVNDAGDIFITGREFTDATSFDAWIARYSPGGDEVWSVTVDGPESGADWGGAIAVSDEGWLVVGGRHDFGDAGFGDAWIARYTIDGDEVWSQTVDGPGSGDDGVSGLAIDGGGAILAVGHTTNEDGDSDVWIRKHNGDGAEVWTRTIAGEGEGDDAASAVAVDGDGNVVTIGDVAVIDKFDTDILLVKHAP